MNFKHRALMLAVVALSGCTMMPAYERPAAPVPTRFPGQAADMTPGATLPVWETVVADARLRDLITLALQNNRDLRVAALNMEQVRAAYQIRRADPFPTLNLATTGNRQPNSSGGIGSTYTAGLAMASWELDFFGRVASLKDAALAQYLSSEEARRSAQTSLVASVAHGWLALQADEALLALTRQTLATREASLRLTRLRFDNGTASALDLHQAESLAAAARGTLAQLERSRAQGLNALTLLVGQVVPEALLPTADDASVALRAVPEGLPSDLLMRRADIRQAEQSLIAANANIGAARAAFFPRIALTASVGTASNELSGLFKDGSWGFTLAPQAVLPLFDAGRNQAHLEVAKVGRDIAVAQYEKAIQTAFREVADALAGRATLGQQLAAMRSQAAADAERLRLTELRYRGGVASSLDLLDAQRSLFATQQSMAQIQLAQQQNQVALYKALGGGY
ncbi:MAG: efflux transporter outer membrane subunit [Hydrogenophaga sp.]